MSSSTLVAVIGALIGGLAAAGAPLAVLVALILIELIALGATGRQIRARRGARR